MSQMNAVAPRLRSIGIGSLVFGGQSTNHDLVPFDDCRGRWIAFRADRKIVRETKAYWIDERGDWWRKSDGLAVPTSLTRIYLVPYEPSRS